MPNFPNYFMIYGPYSVTSFSYFGMIDIQLRHLAKCLKTAKKRRANYIEVKQTAHDRDFAKVLKQRENCVLYAGNCATSNTYYYDHNGDAPLIRPATHFGSWIRSHFINMNNYDLGAKPLTESRPAYAENGRAAA
jgi:cyclohexanone monooxygenase